MDAEKAARAKTIREAVEDGSLIDVTETAKSFHVRCPTFLSSALWNGEFKRSKEELHEVLRDLGCMYDCCFGYDHFGPTDWGTRNSKCTATLEYSEDFGLVMVLSDFKAEDSLGLKRVSGDKVDYIM
jgi:hypothetical protein